MILLPKKKCQLNEFSLIKKYFLEKTILRSDVLLGIGDDAALLKIPSQKILVVSMDTLVEGIHFLKSAHPADIGYKAVAVNVSDLAAMGAEPAWMTLALTIPQADEGWLENFTQGLFECTKTYNMQLIGGDMTRGPLTVTVQVHGLLPSLPQALYRSGAKVGDKIYVSGTLGDAGVGLQVAQGTRHLPKKAAAFVLERFNRPTPRLQLGQLLRGIASSAIDISDGLLADLGHLLEASGVGALLITDHIPLSLALKKNLLLEDAKRFALTAGDDYELCFTVAPENENKLIKKLKNKKIHCSCIGEITKSLGIHLVDYTDELPKQGFLHFS